MTRLRNLAFALLGAVVLQAGPALAVCNQKTASQADRDLWNTHGCWQAFFLWQYQAYDMSGSDWAGRGWDDACNVNKEYPKHWNASYLLTYGLQDNNSFSFHGTVDCRGTAERWDNAYHDDLYHAPTDDTSIFGSWTYHFFGSNEVDTSCLLYDPNLKPNANPGSRGGDFEHEGWHGWMDLYDWDNGSCGGHRCGPVGNCSASGCDYFYFHGIGAYAFGAMWETTARPTASTPPIRSRWSTSVTSRTSRYGGCPTASASRHRRMQTNEPLRGSSMDPAISVAARGPGGRLLLPSSLGR